jgi:peptidyl-dipeptidase A
MRSRYFTRAFGFAAMVLGLTACGGGAASSAHRTVPALRGGTTSWQSESQALLDWYYPEYQRLYTESAQAAWIASTDVSEPHTAARAAADQRFAEMTGAADVIERAPLLLEHRAELEPLTARQLDRMLFLAAQAPQTVPEIAARRVAAEAEQSARLDGYQFCMTRDAAGTCTQPVSTNDIDGVLATSTNLDERLTAWNAAKEVGGVLRDGLVELRSLRNGVAQAMGHDDYFTYMVSDYGMTRAEMMEMLDRLVVETRPLYTQLHCWARYELARRYGVSEPPRLIPAHWIGNRWAQSWPGLVEGVDMDALITGGPGHDAPAHDAQWIVQQAERFYVSLGYPQLPQTFWERSDLYPVPEGQTREKNDHASAWHVDLDHDVRSLMSVEPNWEWFTTTHHELGHIYYFMSYSRPEVPLLLREGANRSYHEGMGDLILLAASQEPYLREIGLMPESQHIDQTAWLLDSALTGPITFLPWSAGVMSHFEHDLYAENLSPEEFNARWWQYVARYQGVAPPSERPATGCDACTKTHINDDPAGYYDYALANVLVYQLHDHICRQILHQDPHACNYYGHTEVGDFLRTIESPGASRDWREVLREATGHDLTAEPMLEYYRPLMSYLEQQNAGRDCALPE